MAVELPHFDLPFRFNSNNKAAVVEQDSEDEIINCVETILRYRKGFREDEPEFGITDPLFSEGQIDTDILRGEVEQWEPRATITASSEFDPLDAAIQTVKVNIGSETNG